jgi:hypothetical protein
MISYDEVYYFYFIKEGRLKTSYFIVDRTEPSRTHLVVLPLFFHDFQKVTDFLSMLVFLFLGMSKGSMQLLN